jgi:serine/threonine-protein kinase
VALYDFGVAEDQTLYFVMELLEGMDLETLVPPEGPLPAARVILHPAPGVRVTRGGAPPRSGSSRHQPANIHLGRLGLSHDFVKVLDFGLVKSVSGASMEHSIETGVGVAPGTPAYIAPEMALGEPVDGRADLYALGCVAYYLLTGRLVFEASTPIQMIARPPARRAGTSLAAARSSRCRLRSTSWCSPVLAKKPDDRPRSAGDLERSLAAIRGGGRLGRGAGGRWWQVNQPEVGRTLPS